MPKAITMDELLAKSEVTKLAHNDFIEGKVISVQKHELWLDIGPLGIGLVPRREFLSSSDVQVGTTVTATVINPETKDGHALLSLRRAMKDKSWEEIQKIYDNSTIVEIKAYDVNRGGLLVELEGVRGFLPVSQLSTTNYPRVSSSDKDEILNKLHKLINQPIKVCVLDMNRKDNKLIFSEKEALKEAISEQFASLKVGDVIKGKVTAIIDFGAFINFNGIEGLIHISEISWERVDDPRKHLREGQEIEVKIISIDKERLALSLKQMTEDPWNKETEKLKQGSEVEGTITRITPYGAFVKISPSVEALLYLSNDSKQAKKDKKDGEKPAKGDAAGKDEDKKPKAKPMPDLKVGDQRTFVIMNLDSEGRKISLQIKD